MLAIPHCELLASGDRSLCLDEEADTEMGGFGSGCACFVIYEFAVGVVLCFRAVDEPAEEMVLAIISKRKLVGDPRIVHLVRQIQCFEVIPLTLQKWRGSS